MCERAGFQQETSLILYEVIYLWNTHFLAYFSVFFFSPSHSFSHYFFLVPSSIPVLMLFSLTHKAEPKKTPPCASSQSAASLPLSCLSDCGFACFYIQPYIYTQLCHDALFVTGSKAQFNRADTGLWCLSGQGPGWAHGRGHHCLPEVRFKNRYTLLGFNISFLLQRSLPTLSPLAFCHLSFHLTWLQLWLLHCLLLSSVHILYLNWSIVPLSLRAGTTQRTTAANCRRPRTISGISTTVWTSFSVTRPSTTTPALWSRFPTAWTIFRCGLLTLRFALAKAKGIQHSWQ